MKYRKPLAFVLALTVPLAATGMLQGCAAPLLVAGAAAGVAGFAIIGDRRPAEVVLEDQNIEMSVARAINDDPALAKDVKVSVTSYYHVVLLTGQIPNEAARQRVLGHVGKLGKASKVHDHLEIGPTALLAQRSRDTQTTARVKSALMGQNGTPSVHVKVVTEKDTVYLMGRVKREEAERVGAIVQGVEGVKMIVLIFEYLA